MTKPLRIRKLDSFIALAPTEGPRVLVADIETFPILALVWRLFKENVGVDQIVRDWSLMSFAAKWLLIPGVFYADNRREVDPRDDRVTMQQLITILQHTDYVIAHNGQRFDVPKVKARAAMLGHPPFAVPRVIDTLQLNKKAFAFSSNRLQFITTVGGFGSEGKGEHAKYPGFKLWLGCLNHERAAWNECEVYNIGDVTELEVAFLKLRGWYEGMPNFAVFHDSNEEGSHRCPNCGSSHVIRKGYRRTQVGIYNRYVCNDCGGWSRGRVLVADKAARAHILMN